MNQHRCILGDEICKLAGDSEKCTNLCPSFIQLHGYSGDGGRIKNANTPKEHKTLHLLNSPVRESQLEYYKVMEKYIKRIFEPRNEKEKRLSLYLYSKNSGTGKTTSAVSLVHTYIIKHYLQSVQQQKTPLLQPAYFLDANEWQTLYNQATRPNVPEEKAQEAFEIYYEMKDMAMNVPFLAIDDLAVRSITEGHRTDLHNVINHRIGKNLPTIYTSNIPIEELPQVFGEQRLYDRIRDNTLVLEFKGESKRGI